jgi:DNA-binding NarL/FixJ family response regulator
MANALAEHQLDAVAAVYNLSKREREVLVLLVSGHGGRYIADELTISYYTVRSHMRNIYEKLCVHNREELLEITHRFQA